MHQDVVTGSSPVQCHLYRSAEPPFPLHLLQIQAVTKHHLSKPSFASYPSQQPSSSLTPLFLNTLLKDILLNREKFVRFDCLLEVQRLHVAGPTFAEDSFFLWSDWLTKTHIRSIRNALDTLRGFHRKVSVSIIDKMTHNFFSFRGSLRSSWCGH